MKEKETDYFNQLMNNEIKFSCFYDVKDAVKIIFDKVTDDCQFISAFDRQLGSTSFASQKLLDMLTHAFPQLIYQVKSTDFEKLVELVCADNIKKHFTVFTDEPKFNLVESITNFIWEKVFMKKENDFKNNENCCINDLFIFSAEKHVTTIISKLIGKYNVLPPVKLTSLNNTTKMDSFLVDKEWMKTLIKFVNDNSDTTYGCYSFTDNSMIKYTTFKENKITTIHIDDMINVIFPTVFNDYEEKNKKFVEKSIIDTVQGKYDTKKCKDYDASYEDKPSPILLALTEKRYNALADIYKRNSDGKPLMLRLINGIHVDPMKIDENKFTHYIFMLTEEDLKTLVRCIVKNFYFHDYLWSMEQHVLTIYHMNILSFESVQGFFDKWLDEYIKSNSNNKKILSKKNTSKKVK